jgi:hypothetical protein
MLTSKYIDATIDLLIICVFLEVVLRENCIFRYLINVVCQQKAQNKVTVSCSYERTVAATLSSVKY